MTTARDICNSVLRKLHVLGQGQIVPDQELNDVLQNINNMLATWSAEGNLVYTHSSDTFSLTGGKSTYTVGSGQDFDTDRILDIKSAYVSQGAVDYSLKSYSQDEYAGITQKADGGIPDVYYYDGNFPTANISLYPVPNGVTTLTINSVKELTGFASLDTDYALPPEYESAIIYNAAVWTAPEYEKEPTRAVYNLANRTKSAIKSQVKRNDVIVSSLDVPYAEGNNTLDNIYRGY